MSKTLSPEEAIVSPEEAIVFKNHIDKIAVAISKFLAEFIMENPGFSSEGMVYGLLGSAACVASSTGCSEETFLDLAEIAYISENKNDELMLIIPNMSVTDDKKFN